MPKDPTRSIERYKISGGHLNEFEYQRNQSQMTEHFEPPSSDEIPGSRPATRAERVAQLIAQAHRKVEKKKKREAAKGRSEKKDAAVSKPPRKAAAPRNGRKKASDRTGNKKAAVRKSAGAQTPKAHLKKAAKK